MPKEEVKTSFTDRLALSTEWNLCKEDISYFISKYLQVYEPRELVWKPFTLWPRQVQYIETLERNYRHGDGMTVEKCRDVGATWLTLAWIFHHWLFFDNFSALVGSRKKEEVAKSDSFKPLFSRLNAFYNQLPYWMQPKSFLEKEHSMSMVLFNPDNRSVIEGESCNMGFGRSNRASVVFLDEYAFWPFDVADNCRHVSNCVIKLSTVNGHNHFENHAKSDKMKDQKEGYPFQSGCYFIFNWDDALTHDQDWYDKEERETDPYVFRREVLRDYNAANRGTIYPGIKDCPIVKGIKYNPDFPLYIAWDYGISDYTVMLFIQRDPKTGELFLLDEVARNGEEIAWFIPFVPGKELRGPNNFSYTEYEESQMEAHNQWTGDVIHFGDPTGNQRTSASGSSVFSELKTYGIVIKTNQRKWQQMDKRIADARKALKRLTIDNRCVYFYESFHSYHIPERRPDSQATSEPSKGVHAFSHAPSAFEAFAIAEPPLMSLYKEAGAGWVSNPWSFKKVG